MALFITIRVNMTDTSWTDIYFYLFWRARNIVNCLLTNHTYRIAYTNCAWESAYSYARVYINSIQFHSIQFISYSYLLAVYDAVVYGVLIVCMAWLGLTYYCVWTFDVEKDFFCFCIWVWYGQRQKIFFIYFYSFCF